VKKQRDELRGIQKKITPKLSKQLYKLLENKTPDKITILMESLVGLLRNVKDVSNNDVELYLRKHESLMYKLNKTDPSSVSELVAEYHYERLKAITKCFTDRNNEYFRDCSAYTPFLAWATQFYFLIQHAKQEMKVEIKLQSIKKDIEERKFRKQMA